MDEISTKLADVVEQTADLINITNDSHAVDHAQIIEEFNSFVRNNPDIENVAGEHLRHGLGESCTLLAVFFSERELKFRFAICRRPSVCRLSVCRLSSVTLVHPTQAIEIFGNVSMPCGTLAIRYLCIKILRRSSQGNPSIWG